MPIPEFVRELRAVVGSQHLLWLPSVNAIVIDDADRVLLHRRSDDGEWSVLSGILDPGEEPAAGVIREVWEETGVQVIPEAITSVTVSPLLTHGNGDRSQYLEVCFRCRPVAGEARVNDDESLEVGWFALDGLPPLRDRCRLRINQALDQSGAWFARGVYRT